MKTKQELEHNALGNAVVELRIRTCRDRSSPRTPAVPAIDPGDHFRFIEDFA